MHLFLSSEHHQPRQTVCQRFDNRKIKQTVSGFACGQHMHSEESKKDQRRIHRSLFKQMVSGKEGHRRCGRI